VDRTEEFRQNEEHPAERMATEKPHRCSTGANHNPRVGGSSPSSGIVLHPAAAGREPQRQSSRRLRGCALPARSLPCL
jgi:hypothetical protein